MSDLESLSSPVDEGVELEAAGGLRAGSPGTREDRETAAERHLVVRGASAAPLSGSHGSEITIETTIGDVHSRTRILETDASPWRWICALRRNGQAWGTAWLAGPRTLITAGHCVFDRKKIGGNHWAGALEIIPGRNGDNAPFGVLRSSNHSTVSGWTRDENEEFDIGCIHLDTPIGDELGWFAVGALTESALRDALVNVSGYPAVPSQGRNQYHDENKVIHVAQRIFYEVDTWGGQSGAPVFHYRDAESPPIVVGIHAYGEGATPASIGESNSGPRISEGVLDKIGSWVENGRDG